MKLELMPIFRSQTADEKFPSLFSHPDKIQDALEKICENWFAYLQYHVSKTESLFDKAELPWEDTERAMVSTLSASISRSFQGSLVLEELGVPKSDSAGRCDLWVYIPDVMGVGGPFNFYLEAKKSVSRKGPSGLLHRLKSRYGVSKIFRDYLKNHKNKIVKLSSYSKLPSRQHNHYVIGMLVTKLRPEDERDTETIKASLREIFETRLSISRKTKKTGEMPDTKRRMDRFPTVAMVVFPKDAARPGVLASFSVLGSTRDLLAR